MQTYSCVVEWFGARRNVEAVASDSRIALLGVGLLRDRTVEIDYRARTLLIE